MLFFCISLPFCQRGSGMPMEVDRPWSEAEEYAIALPKGSELVEQVNQALADLKADGTFDALVAEYIGE